MLETLILVFDDIKMYVPEFGNSILHFVEEMPDQKSKAMSCHCLQ
jgi:hypothetical protein